MGFRMHRFLPHKCWRNRERRVRQSSALRFMSREVSMFMFSFHPP